MIVRKNLLLNNMFKPILINWDRFLFCLKLAEISLNNDLNSKDKYLIDN